MSYMSENSLSIRKVTNGYHVKFCGSIEMQEDNISKGEYVFRDIEELCDFLRKMDKE